MNRLEWGQLDVRLSTLVRVQGTLDADAMDALLGRLPSRDPPDPDAWGGDDCDRRARQMRAGPNLAPAFSRGLRRFSGS